MSRLVSQKTTAPIGIDLGCQNRYPCVFVIRNMHKASPFNIFYIFQFRGIYIAVAPIWCLFSLLFFPPRMPGFIVSFFCTKKTQINLLSCNHGIEQDNHRETVADRCVHRPATSPSPKCMAHVTMTPSRLQKINSLKRARTHTWIYVHSAPCVPSRSVRK